MKNKKTKKLYDSAWKLLEAIRDRNADFTTKAVKCVYCNQSITHKMGCIQLLAENVAYILESDID